MKNAVRTTFVSGSCSAIRRFGCQEGDEDEAESLFLDKDGAILGDILNHQAEEAKPPEFTGDL